jgi:hypothetical protein
MRRTLAQIAIGEWSRLPIVRVAAAVLACALTGALASVAPPPISAATRFALDIEALVAGAGLLWIVRSSIRARARAELPVARLTRR